MEKDARHWIREIYQKAAEPERNALERLLLMKKAQRFGLIADMAGLSDEDKEFLYNAKQITSDEIAEIIAEIVAEEARKAAGNIFVRFFRWIGIIG